MDGPFRAFLAHSSLDKEVVDGTASNLTRLLAAFDRYSFEAGVDIRESIRKALDESLLFVLFASKSALDSSWVRYESDEAFKRSVARSLKRTLVVLLDTTLTPTDLPTWLQGALFLTSNNPSLIARTIRGHLDELVREARQPLFIGRTKELQRLQEELWPVDGRAQPRLMSLWGLSGIGRRTLCERTARTFLNFSRTIHVNVEHGDTAADLAIKLGSHVEPIAGLTSLIRLTDEISQLNEGQVFSRLQQQFRVAIRNRELPVLIDSGGMLEDTGELSPAATTIRQVVDADIDFYCALITSRRIAMPEAYVQRFASVHVSPLEKSDIQRLLAALCKRENIDASALELAELGDYVAGYAPAAHYAVQLLRQYGLKLVLADKARLVDFRAQSFVRYLERHSQLGPSRQQLLSLLAVYSPLPLDVIGDVLGGDRTAIARDLAYLIDLSLVVPIGNGDLGISQPVVDAVGRFTGHLEVPHEKILKSVGAHIDDTSERADNPASLDLYRIWFRAAARSGSADASRHVHLKADTIRVTREFYDARDYRSAIEWGRLAVTEAPKSIEARRFLIKALVQEDEYEAALVEIDALRSIGNRRVADFCRGFLERKRAKPADALSWYQSAIAYGDKGVAVYRELALCYISLNRLEEADSNLRRAAEREPDSRFVIDLQVKLAILRDDEAESRKMLERLRLVDRDAFYLHRKSTVEGAFGHWSEALEASREAVTAENNPAPWMLTQLANCLIETGELSKAGEILSRIEKGTRRFAHDIVIGLRCKLEIRRGSYQDALALWNQAWDKTRPVHLAMRREILSHLQGDRGINEVVRVGYQNELKEITKRLDGLRRAALMYALD